MALPPSLALLLRKHRSAQEHACSQLGRRLTDKDFVLAHLDGRPLNPNAVTLAFIRLIRRSGLPHIRRHGLRHTHATLMLKAGMHPKVVSERLGHAGVGITLDTYSHVLSWLQEATRSSLAAVACILSKGYNISLSLLAVFDKQQLADATIVLFDGRTLVW